MLKHKFSQRNIIDMQNTTEMYIHISSENNYQIVREIATNKEGISKLRLLNLYHKFLFKNVKASDNEFH